MGFEVGGVIRVIIYSEIRMIVYNAGEGSGQLVRQSCKFCVVWYGVCDRIRFLAFQRRLTQVGPREEYPDKDHLPFESLLIECL